MYPFNALFKTLFSFLIFTVVMFTPALMAGDGQQVQVEVRFVDTNENMTQELGADFDHIGSNDFNSIEREFANRGVEDISRRDPFANTPSPGSTDAFGEGFLSPGDAETNTILQEVEKSENTEVLSTPKIKTRDTGVALIVTPNVQPDGLQMNVIPEASQTPGPGPVIKPARIQTNVLMNDGQTVALGGLIPEAPDAEAESGVPVLSKIPLIGRLFKSDTDKTAKDELVVFVTPQIADPVNE